MQCTNPDFMCPINRLYSYAADPSAPELQGIKHLICYLDECPHYTIIYPSGLDFTTTNELRKEVSPEDFHSQNISNDHVDFFDFE